MKRTLRSLILGLLVSLCGGTAGAQYIIHIAGNNYYDHGGDGGKALNASLRCPMSVARDPFGNLYIGDGGPLGYNNDACIRKITPDGIITTIAGVRNVGDSASNTQDSIPGIRYKLQGCAGMCIDRDTNLVIADGVSMVLKLDLKTGYIKKIAGRRGVKGDTGTWNWSMVLNSPYDVAVDRSGNLYIAEIGNHMVRRINYGGTRAVTTIAGRANMPGFFGDGGPAINAKLDQPRGLYVDADYNVYIADYMNNRVRMVSGANGNISTVAGSGLGYGGDGGPAASALLTQPVRVTMDESKNLYISDVANQRIRKVAAGTGIITTYAGNGDIFTGPDVLGNGGPATAACIVPYGLAFDDCGNLYVGSSMFNVRAITVTKPKARDSMLCGAKVVSAPFVNTYSQEGPAVYPDPSNGRFTFRLPSAVSEPVDVIVTDMAGRKVAEMTTYTNKDTELNIGNVPGLYLLQASTPAGKWSRKVVVQ
ncbi:hypothetical protein GCM10023093_20050 [Nemorincola caseinilytica]|uniref:T9SS C-terminal target domain-containing protein n=1 Tax=Nemorincola caseinilytica TaxID=2054315 RepID=A0ABP8NI38_9BACT